GSQAAPDTIVLKNGRRIAALSAMEERDKVKYMTSAGELSLPKSIVDHIEKGGFAGTASPPGDATANLTIAPPEIHPAGGGIEDMQRAAVHNGSIDREYIGKLESEARLGNARANFNAALGHHAAAIFEISRGDLERALSDERTAVTYAPDEPALLMNVAYNYLRRNEYKQALDYLERDVLRTLEMHFSAIESELNYTPPEPIGVVLYTEEAFTDITRAPSWAGALYDGRIRVPVQGLTSADAELSRSLKHELTHSFVAQKTKSACMGVAVSCGNHAPTWLQE